MANRLINQVHFVVLQSELTLSYPSGDDTISKVNLITLVLQGSSVLYRRLTKAQFLSLKRPPEKVRRWLEYNSMPTVHREACVPVCKQSN